MIQITIDHSVTDSGPWKSLLLCFAADGLPFEIHCWADDTDAIALARQYGQPAETNWRGGVVIQGVVTPQFRQMLADTVKPGDTELYNKQTPFFSIFLDKCFSSEHYGTENYILTGLEPSCQALLQHMAQLDGVSMNCFT